MRRSAARASVQPATQRDFRPPRARRHSQNSARGFHFRDALKEHAYADEALPIECDQTISQPYIVAYMTERLHLRPITSVLEIGTGSGYQTAILSRLARHVYTIETPSGTARAGRGAVQQLGLHNITAIAGDGTRGWPDFRLFDRIIVTAGARQVPDELLDQLSPCGAMVIPLGPRDDQRITLITRNDGRIEYQTLLPVRFVPLVRELTE